MAPTIDREFADLLLRCFDEPQEAYPVARLFNDWWRYAPEEVTAKYLADFGAVPEQRQALAERWYAPPVDFDALAGLPGGTLGREYHRFIHDNGLTANIAFNYRDYHRMLQAQGALDRMPEEMQYAVLRGFQLHDIMHVLTGYPPIKTGEQSVLAFCLAQLRFPYFAIWLSVTTTRMTFIDPDMIHPLLDAITDAYQAGRRARNVQWVKWEEKFDQPLDALRAEYGIATRPELCVPFPATALPLAA